MDILKILSRGTKPTAKGPKGSTPAKPTLPSAGAQTNPQLYHDDIGPLRGQKRKRDVGASEDEDDGGEGDGMIDEDVSEPSEDLPDVDFFAPKKHRASAPASAKKEERAKKAKTEAETCDTTAQTLPDDECQRLLKSHRLKVTVMFTPEHTPAAAKSKKSKKAQAVPIPTPPTKKGKKPQIFPQPLVSFSQLPSIYHISPRLSENLARQSYRLPTEVQMASLPLLLRPEYALEHAGEGVPEQAREKGVDYLAVAPTGSGKTVSFMIPAIHAALRDGATEDTERRHALRTIVVAPTRELAFQIANEGKKIAMGTGVRIAAMRKGTRVADVEETEVDVDVLYEDSVEEEDGEDIDEEDGEGEDDEEEDNDGANDTDDEKNTAPARHGGKKTKQKRQGPVSKADILVTTPLQLLNFLKSSKTIQRTLPTVASLVLDEADVLLDPLFREQTLGIWSACTNPNLRLSLWSATMGSNIEALVTKRLSSNPNPAPFVRLVVGLKDTAVPNITHKLIYAATEAGKLLALRQLLRPSASSDTPLRPPFLVFTQTIERASSLHSELKYDIPAAAGGPTRIAALHGGLSESARAAIMRRFRAGEIWVLVTTDVLARGVDFAGVNGIVNYDVPGSPAAYVHRAGRTGRAGRAGGVAVTLYTKDDIPFVKSVANVISISEKQGSAASDKESQSGGVQRWLLDALPDVSKDDRKKLKDKGVESRRTGAKEAMVTTRSGWDRKRDSMRRESAVAAAGKQKKKQKGGDGKDKSKGGNGGEEEWGGFDD